MTILKYDVARLIGTFFCFFVVIVLTNTALAANTNVQKTQLKKLHTYKVGELTLDEFRTMWDFTGGNKLGIVDISSTGEIVTYFASSEKFVGSFRGW